MPIFWILVVGAILYYLLHLQEKKYIPKNKKTAPEAAAVSEPCKSETPAVTAEPAEPAEPDEPAAEEAEEEVVVEEVPFLDTIAGLPGELKAELEKLKFATPEAISAASDEALLAIKGIGPARLKQLRGLCAEAMA